MQQLDEANYDQVRPLLDPIEWNTLFARAVIDRDVRGAIYVDSVKRPQIAHIVHPHGMSLLCGDPENTAFHHALLPYLLNTDRSRRKPKEWLQVFPTAWNDVLASLLGAKLVDPPPERCGDEPKREARLRELARTCVVRWSRANFRFAPRRAAPERPPLPDGFECRRIDSTLPLPHGSVIPQHFWPSYQEFLERGVGFAVVRAGALASLAFSAFCHGPRLELGVETAAPYRGHGLAIAACTALIDFCGQRGLTPVWSCRLENTASVRLAQTLGFELAGTYPYYCLPEGSAA